MNGLICQAWLSSRKKRLVYAAYHLPCQQNDNTCCTKALCTKFGAGFCLRFRIKAAGVWHQTAQKCSQQQCLLGPLLCGTHLAIQALRACSDMVSTPSSLFTVSVVAMLNHWMITMFFKSAFCLLTVAVLECAMLSEMVVSLKNWPPVMFDVVVRFGLPLFMLKQFLHFCNPHLIWLWTRPWTLQNWNGCFLQRRASAR